MQLPPIYLPQLLMKRCEGGFSSRLDVEKVPVDLKKLPIDERLFAIKVAR